MVVFASHHFKVPHVVLAVLCRFGINVAGGVRDVLPVAGPRIAAQAVLSLRQLYRLTPCGANDEQLILAADAIAREGQPFTIGRPSRTARGFLAARELEHAPRFDVGDPDVVDERVLLEVGLADRVRDPFAVGRDLRTGRLLDQQEIIYGGDAPVALREGGAGGECRGEEQRGVTHRLWWLEGTTYPRRGGNPKIERYMSDGMQISTLLTNAATPVRSPPRTYPDIGCPACSAQPEGQPQPRRDQRE